MNTGLQHGDCFKGGTKEQYQEILGKESLAASKFYGEYANLCERKGGVFFSKMFREEFFAGVPSEGCQELPFDEFMRRTNVTFKNR